MGKHVKTWQEKVVEDPRYKQVQELAAQDRFDEAQALENKIMGQVLEGEGNG